MRTARFLAAALVAAAMGAFVPGCFGSGSSDKPFGLICAAPIEREKFCTSSEAGPVSAWKEAKKRGPEPIQMWVERSADMSLDALVTSESDLVRWFNTINTVVEHVRDKERSAESYRATMQGPMGALLKEAKDRQKELLLGTAVDAASNLKKALLDKASAEKEPLVALIASDKQSMGAVQAVFDHAKTGAAPFATEYASLAKDFSAYCETEAAETASYTLFAADASKATLDGLTSIEEAILEAALFASAKPNALMKAAMKLSADIQQFELASQEAIEPHADFMMTHGAALPDMTSRAQRSLNAMLGYIERRVARSDATATSLLLGVSMRRKALEMLAESSAMQGQMVDAKLQKASTVFEGASSARVNALKGALPLSATLGLPYLAKRYDELTTLLQMEPLCNPASSSWRDAGCASLRDNFKDATTYLKTTLPSLLSTGLATMEAKGAPTALLDRAQTKLNAGDTKGAAILHDAALRSVEGI